MTDDEFWKIIDRALPTAAAGSDAHADAILSVLQKLDRSAVLAFHRKYDAL